MINQYIAKIEGHGKLDIDFTTNKAKLIINEGERLIEGIVLGRPYYDAPFITSRICGVCPIAHNLASIYALENALKIEIDPLTRKLRDLMLCAQIIQSHTLHLYFLALSDYLGLDSTLSLAESNPEIFADALILKKTVDHLADAVAGRNVHPITTTLGGFLSIPPKKKLDAVLNECEEAFAAAKRTVRIFSDITYPNLQKSTNYLALTSHRGYTMQSDIIESFSGETFKAKNYSKKIVEKVIESPAKVSTYNNQEFMVGALSRLSLHANRLAPIAKKIHQKNMAKFEAFPAYNSFHNNYAQSVEIVHFLETAMEILKQLLNDSNYKLKPLPEIKLKTADGCAVIEAPRGILYHYYEINNDGKITNCNIITPTAQSLNNLESDAQVLLNESEELNHKERAKLVEMLIRAYDPCITCSVH